MGVWGWRRVRSTLLLRSQAFAARPGWSRYCRACMGSVGVARFVFSTGSHSGILVTSHNGPKKTTPPLLFPTSVPFLTHVNFSRVFLRFYHSQGIRTNIHPETTRAKSFFHEPFLFSAMLFLQISREKKPGALLPQLWLRPPIPKTLTAETLRCSALVNERLPVKCGCPKNASQ